MSSVRRCDACGAIGESPYEGWLTVTSRERQEATDNRYAFLQLKPKLSFDVCSHSCLPELAFSQSDAFVAGERT